MLFEVHCGIDHVIGSVSVQTMAEDAKFVNYFGNFYAQFGLKYVVLTQFEGRRASKSGCGLY